MNSARVTISQEVLIELLYGYLNLEKPEDKSMRLPLLRYRLADKVYRLRVHDLIPEIAAALGCSNQTAHREVRKIQQCELPSNVRAVILEFTKT